MWTLPSVQLVASESSNKPSSCTSPAEERSVLPKRRPDLGGAQLHARQPGRLAQLEQRAVRLPADLAAAPRPARLEDAAPVATSPRGASSRPERSFTLTAGRSAAGAVLFATAHAEAGQRLNRHAASTDIQLALVRPLARATWRSARAYTDAET